MKRLTPPFLQKIDHYLVVNHPHIWATQIHKLLFWGGLYVFAAILLLLSVQINQGLIDIYLLRKYFFPFASFAIFLFWSYQIYLFLPSKRFADIDPISNLMEVFCYFLGFSLLFMPIFLVDVLRYRLFETTDNWLIFKKLSSYFIIVNISTCFFIAFWVTRFWQLLLTSSILLFFIIFDTIIVVGSSENSHIQAILFFVQYIVFIYPIDNGKTWDYLHFTGVVFWLALFCSSIGFPICIAFILRDHVSIELGTTLVMIGFLVAYFIWAFLCKEKLLYIEASLRQSKS